MWSTPGAARANHRGLRRPPLTHLDGWEGRGNGLLIYLLQRRSGFRIDERDLVPGHPVYDRLRAGWEAGARECGGEHAAAGGNGNQD